MCCDFRKNNGSSQPNTAVGHYAGIVTGSLVGHYAGIATGYYSSIVAC